MKISHGEAIITPEIGIRLAGYGTNSYSVAKRDDLIVSALVMDDGSKKSAILSYDLIGLAPDYISRIREEVTALWGGEPADCILSCTHTHSGPNTRRLAGCDDIFAEDYLKEIVKVTVDLVKGLLEEPFVDTDVFFFSINCDENINRRYVGPENKCSFLPMRRDLERMADGICDKEIGGLCFMRKGTRDPEYYIGNFAAHPLAGHAMGVSALRISADFPGAFRDYIERETGAGCMYLTGAAGDMVPRGHETGSDAIEKVGTALAVKALEASLVAIRNPQQHKLTNETLQSCIEKCTFKVRPCAASKMSREYDGKTEIELEVQLLSVGDVCLIGVPGEMVAELGLEMKWHSPFRKTFILYDSTAYISYMCHGNALVAGGYEAQEQVTDSRTGLKLLNTAIDGAYKLYERTYPDETQWPENHLLPTVSLKNI